MAERPRTSSGFAGRSPRMAGHAVARQDFRRRDAAARLNLLYVGTLPPHPGGSAIVASYLLPGFLREGHRIRALAPLPANIAGTGDDFAAAHPRISVTQYPMPYHSNSLSLGSTDESYRRAEHSAIKHALPRLIARERPDILILGRESVAWHVAPVTQHAEIPSLLLVHGGATFAGLVSADDQQPHFRRLRAHWRRIDQIVTVAAHLGRALTRLGFLNVSVIPNPVDIARFSPGPKSPALLGALEISSHDFVILHASNLRRLKRPADIVASAEIALKVDPRLLYLIVGDGPCRAEMETACREKGIGSRFRFPGWVDHSRMPEYIRLADIVVMSSDSEGQSLAYLEAQACSRVLLASNIEAAREIILDGETGVLFGKGNVHELARKTVELASRPLLCARIGTRARDAARTHAVDVTLEKYTDCFEHLIVRCRHASEALR